jgi:transcriptional regulator with XRE-family HTH domain
MEISTTFLAEAILALRHRLGKSQEWMAREIGCPLRSYTRWERGESEPGGTWLIKILRLCPDRESLEHFGITVPVIHKPKKTGLEGPVMTIKDPEIREKLRKTMAQLKDLQRLADEGNRAAQEAVGSIVETYVRAAGIATDPTIPKGRRKDAISEVLRQIAESQIKTSKGV